MLHQALRGRYGGGLLYHAVWCGALDRFETPRGSLLFFAVLCVRTPGGRGLEGAMKGVMVPCEALSCFVVSQELSIWVLSASVTVPAVLFICLSVCSAEGIGVCGTFRCVIFNAMRQYVAMPCDDLRCFQSASCIRAEGWMVMPAGQGSGKLMTAVLFEAHLTSSSPPAPPSYIYPIALNTRTRFWRVL